MKVVREYFRFDAKANGLLFVFSPFFISFHLSFINVYCSKIIVLKRLQQQRCNNVVTNKLMPATELICTAHLFVQSFVFHLAPLLKQRHFNANDHNRICTMQFPNWQCMHLLPISIVDECIFASCVVLFATLGVQFRFTYRIEICTSLPYRISIYQLNTQTEYRNKMKWNKMNEGRMIPKNLEKLACLDLTQPIDKMWI